MRQAKISAIALLILTLVSAIGCSSQPREMITYCAAGCQTSWLGDSYCQTACNCASCYYDNGDCSNGIPAITPTPTPIHTNIPGTNTNIWIGGEGGAAEFDGTNWTAYPNLFGEHSLVWAIAIDNAGNVWFGGSGGDFLGDFTTDEGDHWVEDYDVIKKYDGTHWTTYEPINWHLGGQINSIVFDNDGNTWVSTYEGVFKIDGIDWTAYNTTNSGLPSDVIFDIAIDSAGNKWFGSARGVTEYDGTHWTTYNPTNSGLGFDAVFEIAIDNADNKWFVCGDGLVKFDGVNWTTYNATNSCLPISMHSALFIDSAGNKWFCGHDGDVGGACVSKFDGTNWTTYNATNSGLPSGNAIITTIAIDSADNKWFGAWLDGVIKFDGTNWTTYNTTNSGLALNTVFDIAIDNASN